MRNAWKMLTEEERLVLVGRIIAHGLGNGALILGSGWVGWTLCLLHYKYGKRT
jgi:hypothetical protein